MTIGLLTYLPLPLFIFIPAIGGTRKSYRALRIRVPTCDQCKHEEVTIMDFNVDAGKMRLNVHGALAANLVSSPHVR